jgi:putative acetyltransferase
MQEQFEFIHIQPQHNEELEKLIKTVMPEFKCVGPGYSINDPEVSQMYQSYQQQRSVYFVITKNDQIVGGGGIAPLQNAEEDVCELRKMYLYPNTRGLGLGQKLLVQCLQAAKNFGFNYCYLETADLMHKAQSLYQRMGFQKLNAPMGETGHHSCQHWYLKNLSKQNISKA